MLGSRSCGDTDFEAKDKEDTSKVRETPEKELSDTYQLERCISWVTQNNFQKTCLQFQENLLGDGVAVALYLEKALGRTFYVLADTTYRSCCVDHKSAEHINGDSIIHFGHACLSHFTKLPVLYIFEKCELNLEKLKAALANSMPTNNYTVIFYDDIYHHLYNDLCDNFKSSNFEVSKLVTECNETEDKERKILFGRSFRYPPDKEVTALFLGNDCITLQNLAVALPDVSWYYYASGELRNYEMSTSQFLMRKYRQLELVRDANVMGILIETMGIDSYLTAIDRVKVLAKNHGKKCYILAMSKPNVCKLANFPEVEIFVTISCPENASKNSRDYYKPIVSLFEVEMALGNHLFRTEYLNDFREVLRKYSSLDEEEELNETDVSLTSGKIRSRVKFEDVTSLELQEKAPGALVESKGAEFLSSRSWKGLEQNLGNSEVKKAELGRSGIPLAYRNEYSTLGEKDQA